MGLVINRTASRLNLGDLYEKLDIGAPVSALTTRSILAGR